MLTRFLMMTVFSLGCCPFQGGGSVAVDFLFIFIPIVGVCNCLERAGCFA